jgi:glycine/D-amino acid oxidase-like deaminating enzyme
MEDKTFFPNLPFTPAKGHTMDIHWPGVELDKVIQASVFVLPLGNEIYRVGSTYSWANFNEEVEEGEIDKLKSELKKLCDLPFTVVKKRAGVRPAVKDRRPLIGEGEVHKGVWHFGGFGSRAVLTCPKLSLEFIDSIFGGYDLPSEIALKSRSC